MKVDPITEIRRLESLSVSVAPQGNRILSYVYKLLPASDKPLGSAAQIRKDCEAWWS